MRKFGVNCPIRKPNPYKKMLKSMATNNYAKNVLNREFTLHGPRYVLLTDITYFFYGSLRFKAYLSVIKDAYTKERENAILTMPDDTCIEGAGEVTKKMQEI